MYCNIEILAMVIYVPVGVCSYRLTPPYMLIIMVYIPLFPYLGSGPMWAKDGTELNYCKDSWWYNLLYINNFRTVGEQVSRLLVTGSKLAKFIIWCFTRNSVVLCQFYVILWRYMLVGWRHGDQRRANTELPNRGYIIPSLQLHLCYYPSILVCKRRTTFFYRLFYYA